MLNLVGSGLIQQISSVVLTFLAMYCTGILAMYWNQTAGFLKKAKKYSESLSLRLLE